MFQPGDKIGLVCCSNGLPRSGREKIEELKTVLESMGLPPVFSPFLYEENFDGGNGFLSGTAAERAGILMDFYQNPEIRAIFDLSGGDAANELLDLLDYETIKKSGKPFFGYSDLTVILNGIYAKTGNAGYLYQLLNLVHSDKERQKQNFFRSFMEGKQDLFQASWKFLQGDSMSGIVVGGNARCFLKLAGTPYMPDMDGKLLFMEARGGGGAKLLTELSQLRQIGVFEKVNGILLGTFLEMEHSGEKPDVKELVRMEIGSSRLPVAKTSQIGHGPDARCLGIGRIMEIGKQ